MERLHQNVAGAGDDDSSVSGGTAQKRDGLAVHQNAADAFDNRIPTGRGISDRKVGRLLINTSDEPLVAGLVPCPVLGQVLRSLRRAAGFAMAVVLVPKVGHSEPDGFSPVWLSSLFGKRVRAAISVVAGSVASASGMKKPRSARL